VAVINISLVGPKNLLLARVVAALIARGYVIVAAVGNDGSAAPPLYPAAYRHVISVTAVDAERRVLFEAERGPQVTFAAQGADLKAANLRQVWGANQQIIACSAVRQPCVANSRFLGRILDADNVYWTIGTRETRLTCDRASNLDAGQRRHNLIRLTAPPKTMVNSRRRFTYR